MFVLGIDPGLTRCGYGCVERTSKGMSAVSAGILTTPRGLDLPDRLAALDSELTGLIHQYRPDAVAVERVLFQANARTAMSVGQASGLALVAAARNGSAVFQYSANEVKLAVAGYGSATKLEVQRMVKAQLSLDQVPTSPDVADALALAICHLSAASWRESVTAALSKEGT